VRPALATAGLADHALVQDATSLHRLLELLRPRAKRLTDFAEQLQPLLTEPVVYEQAAVDKYLSSPELAGHVTALNEALDALPRFDEASIEAAVRGTAEERGLKAGSLIHATRVAITGRTASPGLFEVLAWLGRERTRLRLAQLLHFLAREMTK
jgi:glutamyl-tRNA synthetase